MPRLVAGATGATGSLAVCNGGATGGATAAGRFALRLARKRRERSVLVWPLALRIDPPPLAGEGNVVTLSVMSISAMGHNLSRMNATARAAMASATAVRI